MTHSSNHMRPSVREIQGSVQNSDIMWLGDAWICRKHLKHYPAFCRSGTTISICSFVFVKSEEETDYLGYVEDLFEDLKGEKLVRVRWFQFREEMVNRISNLDARSNEVFITDNKQVIDAESIDGIAIVFTPDHFNKCLTCLPRDFSLGGFVCHKEYKENKIKPFHLSELCGYSNQPILSTMKCHLSRQKDNEQKSTEKGGSSAHRETVSTERGESSAPKKIVVLALEGPGLVGPSVYGSARSSLRRSSTRP